MHTTVRHRIAAVVLLVLAALAPAVAASVALAPAASAHSDLESSVPADGEVVTKQVTEIRFIFEGSIEPFVAGFTLRTFEGADLPVASVTKADDVTIVAVPAKPIRQVVTAQWAIVSGDSHPITGSIVVAVDLPPPPSTTTATAPPTTRAPQSSTSAAPSSTASPTTTHDTSSHEGSHEDFLAEQSPSDLSAAEQAEILAGQSAHDIGHDSVNLIISILRWVTYATTALLIAATALVWSNARTTATKWHLPRALLAGAVVILGIATVLLIGRQVAALTGDAADIFAFDSWGEVFEGRLRTGIVVRIVAVTCFALALLRTGLRKVAAAAGAFLLLASYPILSHLTADGPAWVTAPSLIVHVSAISIWAGGLLLLLMNLRRAGPNRRELVERFSWWAGIAVLVTTLTGIVMAIVELGSVADLWDSAYGQRLLIKVALVAVVGAIGAVHRYVTIPRMQADENGTTVLGFVRLGWVEIVLFAAVLGATAWLVLAG